ncbi:MAG: protoporphyrinogen oxidase [Oceanipulchritudo sp.]
MKSPEKLDAVVIGGGISGLATARQLARDGKRVRVIEKSARLGGAVKTDLKEGYLCEAGPNSMLVKSENVWRLLHDLGLGESIVEANEQANKRFLVKRGAIVPLPQSPAGGITTPLYSIGEKLRLLAEPFIAKSRLADESVTSFVSRRMGSAFLEYGISALVSGIYAGDPDALSIRHAFPKVWNLEQNHGSLIGGAIKLKRERRREGIVPFKSRMISFRDGLGRLVEALCSEDSMTVSTGTTVRSVSPDTNGSWRVEIAKDGSGSTLRAEQVVLATPLDAYREIAFGGKVRERLAEIDIPEHPPLSTLVLGFDRSQVAHPLDGFGVLCPRLEKRFCLGAIFSSTLFPGRAPEGKVALMCFIGGVMQPENAELETGELVEQTMKDLTPLLGIRGDPEFTSHTFWPRAIPQYNVGHGLFLSQLEKIEADFPGLHLRGNFRGGPGLNDCLESALEFAD